MDLTKEEKAVVTTAIRQHIPLSVEVFFFGSRVDGTSRKDSDLDVLLKGPCHIDLGLIALVRDKLEESNLSFRIDILDYHSCSPEMLKSISKNMVKVLP